MFINTTLFFTIALAAVLVLIPPACRLARRYGFVDRPGGRKNHEDDVPPVGGLVIFPVFMILAVMQGVVWDFYGWFFTALALILVIGALDDRFPVPPWIKFVMQFVAAFLIVIPGGAQAATLGNLFGFGPLFLSWGVIPFSVIATVLLINAVNLMDGLDGLAGGKGLVIMFWFALSCVPGHNANDLGLIVILMGTLVGFLVYNMRHPFRDKASIFIGDAGSMALGLTFAWFSLHLSQGENAVIQPVAVAWVLALPIFDTCGQFARRIREGRHPFDADQNHFHHHFVNEGIAVGQATGVILLIIFLTGLIGVGGTAAGIPAPVLAYVWTALLLVHIFMSLKPDRYRKIIKCLSRKN